MALELTTHVDARQKCAKSEGVMSIKRVCTATLTTAIVACGSSGGGSVPVFVAGFDAGSAAGRDGSVPGFDAGGFHPVGNDATTTPPHDSGTTVVHADAGTAPPPHEAGPPPWSGQLSGPLTCAGTGAYKTNWANSCGTDRWSVKTGTDSAASQVNMTPKLITVADAVGFTLPTTSTSTPRQPEEMQAYAIKDATLLFARLEDDSDYHLVMSDGVHSFIAEIPYPGCVSGGPWACNISRARAAVDNQLTLVLDQGHNQDLTVSIIGVGFSDFEHGQFGAAPNMFEFHALLAICFGAGCDPTKS